jgi:glycosyltransferase involved in cell wall biosynthesis
LSWEKGVAVLIEAFRHVIARIPDARLLIAGDGPQRQALERLAEELGIRTHVEFMGHIPGSEMEQRMERAWVHVVPSRVMEPFGIAAAEAMMRGTAVVASDTGGLPEIVDHERTGLLVPPRDVKVLTSALVRILADRSLAEVMGRAGRDRALTRLDLSTCADKFLLLYESICSPRLGKTEDGHEELNARRDSRP